MADRDSQAFPRAGATAIDPVLRNAIRYTISAKEYRTLHDYLLKQSPAIVRSRVPQPSKYDAAVRNKDDYNAAAIRASLRVFLAAQTALSLWDIITVQILRRGQPSNSKYADPVLIASFAEAETEFQDCCQILTDQVAELPTFDLSFPYTPPSPRTPSLLYASTCQSPYQGRSAVSTAKSADFQGVDCTSGACHWCKFGWVCAGSVSWRSIQNYCGYLLGYKSGRICV